MEYFSTALQDYFLTIIFMHNLHVKKYSASSELQYISRSPQTWRTKGYRQHTFPLLRIIYSLLAILPPFSILASNLILNVTIPTSSHLGQVLGKEKFLEFNWIKGGSQNNKCLSSTNNEADKINDPTFLPPTFPKSNILYILIFQSRSRS